VFFHNALRFLAGNAAQSRLASLRAGESFSMPVPPNVKTATIHRPDGRKDEVNVRSSGLLSYNQTDRTGFYRVSGGIADDSVRAVNLLNEDESFIAPCRNFRIASGQLVAGDGSQNLRKPLWPYLLMVLGVILLFEWIIYNKRVFI